MHSLRFAASGLALSLFVTVGCADRVPTDADAAAAASVPEASLATTMSQTSGVVVFPDGPTIPGASARRTIAGNGFNLWFNTSGLEPGNAYTLWAAVFNHPSACIVPNACTLADAMAPDPAVALEVIGVTGHVVGGSGRATFSGRIEVGDIGIRGVGVLNTSEAEVHLVLRSHGPKLPGNAQLTEFNGGCPPNACMNVQDAANFQD